MPKKKIGKHIRFYMNCMNDGCNMPYSYDCPNLGGHPACEDFGCAFKLGLGRMVKKDITKDWDL